MAAFYGWRSTASRLEPLWRGSFHFINKFPEFLLLILSTSEGWRVESTLEPPSGFEHGGPELKSKLEWPVYTNNFKIKMVQQLLPQLKNEIFIGS